jgi:hypothetical protein
MRKLALGVALPAATLVAATAFATPPRGVVTDVVDHITATNDERVNAHDRGLRFKSSRGKPFDMLIQSATVHPGWSSGWHGHPGFVIFSVKSGTVTRYDDDCKATRFSAGDAFVESGRRHAVLIRNDGTEPAVAYFTFVVPSGELPQRRIDLPNPGCPVD